MMGPISDSAALSIVWSAALRSLVPRGVDKTVFFSVLFPATRSFEGRRFRSVSCSQRGDEMSPIAKSEPVFHLLECAVKQRLLPWSLPNLMRKTIFFSVSFHRRAMQAWTLFLVSIERGTSRRVYHRPPSLTDMSQFRSAPCRFLARPGCSARRCRRTEARKTAPRPSLMKLFKLVSQG
jgi:hypothetical protein